MAKKQYSPETPDDLLKVVAILSISAGIHLTARCYEIAPLPDDASDSMRNPNRKAWCSSWSK